MSTGQTILSFLGRLFLSAVFIFSGISKILDWQGAEKELVSILCDWNVYLSFSITLQSFFSDLLPYVTYILFGFVACELLGGLLLLFGLQIRLGAFFLAVSLFFGMFFFHQFWFLEEGSKRDIQMTLFFKDIAILGGLFCLLAYGKGEKKGSAPKPKK